MIVILFQSIAFEIKQMMSNHVMVTVFKYKAVITDTDSHEIDSETLHFSNFILY